MPDASILLRMKIPMAAAVLAGGGSRRMGVPKASLPYGKTTLLAHQTGRLSKMFEEVLVVAKEAPGFDAGPSRLVLDRTSDQAPIHGLARALEEASDRLFVLAVDLPAMTDEVIRIIAERSLATDAPAILPRAEGRLQPLAAVWRRSVLPAALPADRPRGTVVLRTRARSRSGDPSGRDVARRGSLGQLLCQHQHDRAVQRDAGAGMTEEEKPPKGPRRPRSTGPLRGSLLHLDSRGRARMVDVGGKASTRRRAVARGRVRLNAAAFGALAGGKLSKGDALAVARLAGILAAKKTSEIIPLAHPIGLDAVSVECELAAKSREVIVTATASTAARTGVEMEALTAVAGACLALYDMAKALDRSIEIREILLLEKTGGRSGTYRR